MLACNLRCYFDNKVLKKNISEIVKQMFGPFEMKCSSLKWNYFWSLQDRLLPISLRWLSECNQFKFGLWDILKSDCNLPISTRLSSETEMPEMQAGSNDSKEGQPLQEGGAGPVGRPLPGPNRQRSSWGHASSDGHRMVIPALCRPVASSLDCLAPGQVVFSVPLCFIGVTPAVPVKLPQFYSWVLVSRAWSVCYLCNSC